MEDDDDPDPGASWLPANRDEGPASPLREDATPNSLWSSLTRFRPRADELRLEGTGKSSELWTSPIQMPAPFRLPEAPGLEEAGGVTSPRAWLSRRADGSRPRTGSGCTTAKGLLFEWGSVDVVVWWEWSSMRPWGLPTT